MNACTEKGRAKERGPPCIGKEEELALRFFCFFSDESRKGMRSFAVLRPGHNDVSIAGVVGNDSRE